MKPGAKIAEVAEGYARQAAQKVSSDTKPLREVLRVGRTVVTTFHPPGGAGGYSSTIWAIDQPGGEDFIHYQLIND